ncbi:MAG: hypothetical protein R2830_19305 [Saprospiraceae bacterium]
MPKLVTAYDYYRATGTTGDDFQDRVFHLHDNAVARGGQRPTYFEKTYSGLFTIADCDLEPVTGDPHSNADAEREERIMEDVEGRVNWDRF